MRLETPLWPLDRFECRGLMSIVEIEEFAPHIVAEIDDETTFEEAELIPGGFEAWCRRERQRQRRLQSTQ